MNSGDQCKIVKTAPFPTPPLSADILPADGMICEMICERLDIALPICHEFHSNERFGWSTSKAKVCMYMSGRDKIIKEIRNNAREINAFGVKKIGLFGSYTSGRHNAGSDIDILVEFANAKKEFDNYMELKFYLEALFHRRIDLVIKDALKPRIRRNILKEVMYA
jgi:predicted nucleotidyltransferase